MNEKNVFRSEPLAMLARFSWDQAPQLCQPEHGCCDYHRGWSLVRWLELGGELPAGLDFFQRELSVFLSQSSNRILISGAADTGVLSMVLKALSASQIQPEIVFADRCRTTVQQNTLLAKHVGKEVQFHCCDIRELDCSPVDIIIAHSFLLFFEEPPRQQVINAWSRLLKPGGKVLMSNSITDDEREGPPPKDINLINRRVPELIKMAHANGFSESDANEVGATAHRIWQKSMSKPPYITADNLQRGFMAAGLSIENIASRGTAYVGPLRAFSKPTGNRTRAEVVAVKAQD